MRSTTHNDRLNHLILLYVHQEKIAKIDICKIDNEFIVLKDPRKGQFSLLQVF